VRGDLDEICKNKILHWSSPGWGKGSLPMAGGWKEKVCKVSPSPAHSAVIPHLLAVVFEPKYLSSLF